ncbi:hypothetical protein [Spirosoma telluris]|uniref:hypothetical protein n=1 Tax=Spirosoma telluris TaxID=2183553 RepID=UPI002FC2A317
MNKRLHQSIACFILLLEVLSFSLATAQGISSPQIDALVQKTLTTFDVPGIAVAVIKDGKVIHSKGYGVRSLKTGEKSMNIPCSVLRRIARRSPRQPWRS